MTLNALCHDNSFIVKEMHKLVKSVIITLRVRLSRGEMYIGHSRLCEYVSVCLSVSVSVPHRIPILLHGPGCNLGEW